MSNEQLTGLTGATRLLQYHGQVRVDVNDEGNFAGLGLTFALWTGGETGIWEGVEEEVITRTLFSRCFPGPGYSTPDLFNNCAGSDFTHFVLVIKGKGLLDIISLGKVILFESLRVPLSVGRRADVLNYREQWDSQG